MSDFKPNAEAKEAIPGLTESFRAFAFAQAEEFMEYGQSPGEATSIVAHILIKTAWVVAASGALSEGREPQKDNFRAVVEEWLERIEFDTPATERDTP